MQMNFCTFIRKLKSVITVLFCLSVSLMGAKIKPNIIFIFIDDQGYYDLGCYGAAEVKTPRIDAMAKAGTRFTDYYAAAPICSPSRAGLLTGCYPRRVGNHIWVHRADSRSGIHTDELTIAELLKAGGYATACIGKWHLGFHEPFLPRNQGQAPGRSRGIDKALHRRGHWIYREKQERPVLSLPATHHAPQPAGCE
jgi:arylsulfatase A-like enzyme